MSGSSPHPDDQPPSATLRREIKWDAVAAIIAALVGFLALLVAAYTAYVQRYTANIQREQVSAQVWPYLISGNNDLVQSLVVDNKGVGPAIVRSVQVLIDGKPRADWDAVLTALGLRPHHFTQTSINHEVLSPGEELKIIRFPDAQLWQRFHDAAAGRIGIDICFCSTLGECWMSSNKTLVGTPSMALQVRVQPIADCPKLAAAEVFNN